MIEDESIPILVKEIIAKGKKVNSSFFIGKSTLEQKIKLSWTEDEESVEEQLPIGLGVFPLQGNLSNLITHEDEDNEYDQELNYFNNYKIA